MINVSIKKGNFDVSLLVPKETLYLNFWEDNKLKKEVSDQLKKITEDIIHSMDIEAKIKDVTITGSIASYNWHEMSDIDLHIMFDFRDINDDFSLVKKMLDQSRINWNKTHNILIHGKEVEIYFQDLYEPHESNGIWSLQLNKWLAEPIKLNPDLDMKNSEKKAEALAKSILHIEDLFDDEHFEEAYSYASKLKRKLSRLRKAGLNRDGLYSQENLAFKMLRNAGYLGILSTLKVKSYDKKMSLSEAIDYFPHRDPDHHKFEGQYEIEHLLAPDGDCPWTFDRKLEKN